MNGPGKRATTTTLLCSGCLACRLPPRYVRGSDIDGTRAGGAYSYYNGIEDGRHWERNLWVRYVVQGGPARNLSFNVMQATHRVGGGHTAEANVDELRVIVEYPLDISL